MSDWPPILVLIVTYDRPREIRLTIDALLKNMRYSGLLHWHLADDMSPEGYISGVKESYPDLEFTITVTERQGWGANVNKAMTYCFDQHKSDYIFLCEDDYVSMIPFSLDKGIALLEAMPDLGLIRYDGIDGHALDLALREADTKLGRIQYLEILGSSPHLNVYSNRPHLKHKRFHDIYGEYSTGTCLGMTETVFAHNVRNKYAPGGRVATLDDGITRAFDHIGHSRQGSEFDV